MAPCQNIQQANRDDREGRNCTESHYSEAASKGTCLARQKSTASQSLCARAIGIFPAVITAHVSWHVLRRYYESESGNVDTRMPTPTPSLYTGAAAASAAAAAAACSSHDIIHCVIHSPSLSGRGCAGVGGGGRSADLSATSFL